MRQLVKYSGIIAIGLAVTTGLTACGGSLFERDKAPTEADILLGQEGRTLWETGLQYAKIVDRDLAGIANEHPASISTDDMRTVLGALYVNERIGLKKQDNPVFSVGELQILSAALANGLSQAETNDDITFVSIGSHPTALAREAKTTSGRVFVSGGRLNIIFGKLHETYKEKDPLTNQPIDRRVNPLLPGSRKSVSDIPTPVALDKGQSFYLDPETGRERTDWLIIDVATVLATAKERSDADKGDISPELIEDIAKTKQETGNLTDDVSNMKEIMFDMSGEIERLKREIEELKSKK
jgi:hypothetical protein